MPLNAVGWTTQENETLVRLVEPNSFLYNISDPSRKNILARESTWQEIAEVLSKPVEECKKRWRGLRDGYMRSKRMGTVHKTKAGIFEKLQFLDALVECEQAGLEETSTTVLDMGSNDISNKDHYTTEEQVITDNQEYYEITVLDGTPAMAEQKPLIKVMPKLSEHQISSIPQKRRTGGGRKKTLPMPNIAPVKILPKPILVNGPKILQYVEDPKTPEHRSQVIDKLIERVLKENTNEIDVFFRSMAASVKKLQPNLIPKVKMEVCNVIAKYEMQSFDKNF